MSNERTTIADLRDYPEGTPLSRPVLVRVSDVYEKHTGVSEYGEWAIQNAMVRDDTGTIKVVCKAAAEVSLEPYEGELVWIQAYHSPKHGWVGATVEIDDYGDQPQPIIKLTKTAQVTPRDGGGERSSIEQTTTSAPAQSRRESPRAGRGGPSDIPDVWEHVSRLEALRPDCELALGDAATADTVQRLLVHLSIALLGGELAWSDPSSGSQTPDEAPSEETPDDELPPPDTYDTHDEDEEPVPF